MQNKTILLVEDNADDIELALTGLQEINCDFHVEVACDGKTALSYLFDNTAMESEEAKNKPDLILLDIKLPDMNGFDLLKQVRANKSSKRIPVVIFSSSDEASDISRGYDLGANSYLQKPLSYDTFTQVLEYLGLYWLTMNIVPRY